MFKKGGGGKKRGNSKEMRGSGEDRRNGNSFFEPVRLSGYEVILLLLLHVWAVEFRGRLLEVGFSFRLRV